MLAFHPRFIRTFEDLPGHLSLLIHAWGGCNMRCYGCHNHAELIAKKPERHLNAAQVVERIAGSGSMFDAILFSGGEFFIQSQFEIEHMLQQVRASFNGKIIVFTNGSYPRKLERLLLLGLVDGVHIDMKLPYHCLDPEDEPEVYEAIIGVVPAPRFCSDMLDSIEQVIRHNSRFSQVRTVRYPLLSEEYFTRIQEYVQALNVKHNSQVPYYLNPYYPPQNDSISL